MYSDDFMDRIKGQMVDVLQQRVAGGLLPVEGKWMSKEELEQYRLRMEKRALIRFYELITLFAGLALLGAGIVLLTFYLAG